MYVILQIGVFLFGCAVSQSFTDIAKVSVGRLRPHFLDVCRPNFSTIDCSLGYITNYNCTGEDSDVQEARLVKSTSYKDSIFYVLTISIKNCELKLYFFLQKILLLRTCLLFPVYHALPGCEYRNHYVLLQTFGHMDTHMQTVTETMVFSLLKHSQRKGWALIRELLVQRRAKHCS